MQEYKIRPPVAAMVPVILILDILLSLSPQYQIATAALEQRLGKTLYPHVLEYMDTPLLKKHFIIVWEDWGENVREILHYSPPRLTKAEEDSAIVSWREHGIDAWIESFPNTHREQTVGIGFDTTFYFLNGRHRQNEFNKMMGRESLSLDNADKAVELAKLFIYVILASGPSWPHSWKYADGLEDSATFLLEFKGEKASLGQYENMGTLPGFRLTYGYGVAKIESCREWQGWLYRTFPITSLSTGTGKKIPFSQIETTAVFWICWLNIPIDRD